MNFDSWGDGGVAFGWHVHMIFAGLLTVGAILLIIWAYKTMDKKQLKNWTLWLIVIGLIGTLLTGGLGVRGFKSMMDGKGFGDGKSCFDFDDDNDDFRNGMFKIMDEYYDLNK